MRSAAAAPRPRANAPSGRPPRDPGAVCARASVRSASSAIAGAACARRCVRSSRVARPSATSTTATRALLARAHAGASAGSPARVATSASALSFHANAGAVRAHVARSVSGVRARRSDMAAASFSRSTASGSSSSSGRGVVTTFTRRRWGHAVRRPGGETPRKVREPGSTTRPTCPRALAGRARAPATRVARQSLSRVRRRRHPLDRLVRELEDAHRRPAPQRRVEPGIRRLQHVVQRRRHRPLGARREIPPCPPA